MPYRQGESYQPAVVCRPRPFTEAVDTSASTRYTGSKIIMPQAVPNRITLYYNHAPDIRVAYPFTIAILLALSIVNIGSCEPLRLSEFGPTVIITDRTTPIAHYLGI